MRFLNYIILVLFCPATAAMAGSGIVDQFDYSTGSLTANSGGVWTALSSGGTNPVQVTDSSITTSTLSNVTGGAITFGASGSGETVTRGGFSIPATGNGETAYFSGVFTITSAFSVNTLIFYFRDGPGGTSNIFGKLWVKTSGSGFKFGVNYGASDITNYGATVFPFNQPVFVVVKLQSEAGNSDDMAYLFTDPALDSGEPGFAAQAAQINAGQNLTDLTYIAIAQNGGAGSVDSIRVAKTWAEVTHSDMTAAVPVSLSELRAE